MVGTVLCSQERSHSACMRKVRLPNFAKELQLKRYKLSSIVRENGGTCERGLTPFVAPSHQTCGESMQPCLRKTCFLYPWRPPDR